MSRIKQHLSITQIVILILAIVTTVVLSLFGTFNYYHERNIRLSELRSELRVQSGQLSNSLTLAIWNFDFGQADKIIESTMQNRDIFGIVLKKADQVTIISACVRDTQGNIIFTKSDISTKGLLFENVNIIFNDMHIGTVSVFISPRFMEKYLLNFLLVTMASIITLNICLVFVLFQLLSRTVIKPIKAIESYALKVGTGDPEGAIIQEYQFLGELENLRCSILQMTQSLKEAQDELIRKNKLAVMGQLAGIVGHEIRNPLGVMSNAVYFLKMVLADADDTVKEYLEIIKQEIDNSQRIISDLLDFARTKTPQISSIAPGTLVTQSLGKCRIPENIEVKTKISETLPKINIDPFQIGQVLQNLIINAVQAMTEGGRIDIDARLVQSPALQGSDSSIEPATDFIEISVIDTGEGISEENMKNLFQPLFTTKAKGIGLGLVVCRNLTEANGGRIGVKNRSGEGTTFTVTLPVEGSQQPLS